MTLLAPWAGTGCGSDATIAGGGDDSAITPTDGDVETGPVSVLPGSPITLTARAADGTVSGTLVDPKTLLTVSFSVRATSATSAVASYTLDTMSIQVTLSDAATAIRGNAASARLERRIDERVRAQRARRSRIVVAVRPRAAPKSRLTRPRRGDGMCAREPCSMRCGSTSSPSSSSPR